MRNKKGEAPIIHPTAVVHTDASIGEGTTIGEYSVIGKDVVLEAGNTISNHVTILGPTRIGRDNIVYSYASIGQDPQDKKFHGESESFLEIGDGNVIREFTTINRGTEAGGSLTRIGNGNWIMAYCHIAHDCQVGDDTIFSNNVALAGHVVIHNKAYLGGFTAVHQFCTIGEMTMTGAQSMITQDVAPYMIAVGNRAKLFGVNKIGLERNGLSKEDIQIIDKAYKIFFRAKLSAADALERIRAELPLTSHVETFLSFIENATRGICR